MYLLEKSHKCVFQMIDLRGHIVYLEIRPYKCVLKPSEQGLFYQMINEGSHA